jgi:peptidoglycan hydrolase-like protein with peptidoglycan-binding domain
MALEQRLNELRYDVGKVDGVFDTTTAYAVTAFQKVTGRSRTGRATDDVVAALPSAALPAALVPGGGANRVEIDLKRQVLFLYEGNALAKILPVSTGSGERFCVDGRCERAITPGGSFRIYRRAKGWETSPLGRLYNSQYFNAGIAIHGSPSVPPYPASHGCVRIPMSAAEWFPDHVFYGTPVYVFGGPIAPAPFADVPPVPGTTPEPPPTTVPVTTAPRPTTPSTLLVPLTVARTTTTTTTAVRAPTTTTTPSRR